MTVPATNGPANTRRTESEPRARLLAAAIEYLQARGISELSLRELAAAIGTSHRMLIYHFGSKEGLLVAVVQAVEEQQRALPGQPGRRPVGRAAARPSP